MSVKRPASDQQCISITVEHEHKINKAVEIYQTQFKHDIRTKVIDLGLNMKCQEQISLLLQYIYEYPSMKIQREQIVSKTKKKKAKTAATEPVVTETTSVQDENLVDIHECAADANIDTPTNDCTDDNHPLSDIFPDQCFVENLDECTGVAPEEENNENNSLVLRIEAATATATVATDEEEDKCTVIKPTGERCMRKLDKNCPGFCSMHKKKHKILVKCICIRGIVYNVDEYGNVYKETFAPPVVAASVK